jgi:hypothetical protein
LTRPTLQHDPMDHLADALVEDILATPGAVLFAESAEDHGDPRALAAEFDRILASSAWPVGARQVGAGISAPRVLARNASQRTAARAATSGRRVSLERLRQSLRSLPGGGRLPSRGLPIAAVSLLALVALSAVAALHWQNRAGPGEELMHGVSPAATRPAPESSEYLVLLPEEPSLDAALASYRKLQGRFVALLGGRDPVIRKGSDHAYVAGIGPFTKADEAKNLCLELKRAGAACDVGEAGR